MFNQLFLEFFRNGVITRRTADAAGVSKNRPEIATIVEQADPHPRAAAAATTIREGA